MKNHTIAGIVVACLAVGLLVGIFAPRLMGHQPEPAASDSGAGLMSLPEVRGVVESDIHAEAKRMAAEMLDRSEHSAPSKPPSGTLAAAASGLRSASASSQPAIEITPVATPITVDRQAFAITLPENSKVDPQDPADGGKLLAAEVPGRGTITIVTIDDKARAAHAVEDALQRLRSKVTGTVDAWPDALALPSFSGSTAFRGAVHGETWTFEIGKQEGREKACLVIVEYPAQPEAARKEASARIRKSLETLRMKG